MENVQGKHFSITDPKGVNTVIYQVYKTKKEFLKEYPIYSRKIRTLRRNKRRFKQENFLC